jgi:prophage regulatory protein
MRFLDRQGLRARGISYTPVHIARLEKKGLFPKHVMVTANRSGWILAEVEEYLKSRVAARDDPNAPPPRPRGRAARRAKLAREAEQAEQAAAAES